MNLNFDLWLVHVACGTVLLSPQAKNLSPILSQSWICTRLGTQGKSFLTQESTSEANLHMH